MAHATIAPSSTSMPRNGEPSGVPARASPAVDAGWLAGLGGRPFGAPLLMFGLCGGSVGRQTVLRLYATRTKFPGAIARNQGFKVVVSRLIGGSEVPA